MIYKLRHLTVYEYDAQVASTALALRLTPREDAAQGLYEHKIDIVPRPADVQQRTDFYGNTVCFVTIDEPHTELRIKSLARVEINHQPTLLVPDTPWEEIAAHALSCRDISAVAPAHFLFPSPRVQLSAAVTDYARSSFQPRRGIVESCRELMSRIRADFAYMPETTTISTPLTEAFAMRRGVCQDFAHIMISGLRGLCIPAGYVSGYLRTLPPPGKARLQGADATHAWVTVWTGEHNGWLGFDPTNAIQAGNDHIQVALGRDFSDVSPVYGTFVGSGHHELTVEVDVIPLITPRLASEAS